MNVNKAATSLAVLWALVVLKKRDEAHSVKNILTFINGKTLTDRTVKSCLDYLEDNNVIVCPYPKRERQGKSYLYALFPFNLPKDVFDATPGDNTNRRWMQQFEDLGLITWKQGQPCINGSFFTEEMTKPLLNISNWIAGFVKQFFDLEPNVKFTHEWIVQGIDGQPFELDDYFLKVFHFFICLQFSFAYPKEALSQIVDVLERKGA
jgi:hypothetical protein